MTTYLLRRLLLMIPTLIGITFVVFMLIALSPGGIGAALTAAGVGGSDASSRAQLEAYLEDRYGLNDPPITQYARWLARVSPVKFGPRDQVDPRGELVRPPRELAPPILAGLWYGESSVNSITEIAEPTLVARESATAEERHVAYRAAARRSAEARAAFIGARVRLNEALALYASAAELRGVLDAEGKPKPAAFERITPDHARPEFAAVETTGNEALAAWRAAERERSNLIGVFNTKPYPQAGVPIIPGVLSLAKPDLGSSFSRSRPVSELIGEALPVTMMLNLIAFPIIYLIAVPSGVLAAVNRGKWFDILSGIVFVALWSIPAVVAGVLMVGFLAGKNYLGWFPAGGLNSRDAAEFLFLPSFDPSGAFQRGWLLDRLWHVALPVACLVYAGFAVLSKQTRAAMLDNFDADYVRTARAKGLPPSDVALRHVLRNSLLPVVTMFASIFPAMLAGSVVIERIFSIPGMGSLLIDAINLRDRELLLANALMIGAVNLLALLLADLLYAALDPRITYE